MDSIKFQIQVHANEPEYVVYDFRGSRTPLFVYQDMQRTPVPDLSEAKVVFDIGANVGLWSFRMAKMYPNCRFIAFEPYPVNVSHFIKGQQENKVQNVDLVPQAVTEDGREITLYMDPTNSGSASMYNNESVYFPKEKAQSVSLSAAVRPFDAIDYMKVDIEGAEFHLFNGFEDWHKIKKVFVEVHPNFLHGDDADKKAQIDALANLLRTKIGSKNVVIDCTDEKFRGNA